MFFSKVGSYRRVKICHFFYPVCDELSLHNCLEFKRILHITTFFVTTFFVVAAKIGILFETNKDLARNLT